MQKFILSVLFTLFSFCYSVPQTQLLSNIFKDTDYVFKNVEDGAALYVASNDNPAYLKQITVQTANKTYSLDQFASTRNGDDTQISLTMTSGAVFRSTLDNAITNILTGFLYITTASQAKDPNFHVYVVSSSRTIQSEKPAGVLSTSVVLNTNLGQSDDSYPPERTAYVTNITQPKTSTLSIYQGFPSSNDANDLKQRIFANPLIFTNFRSNGTSYKQTQFFENIVPMHMDVQCWFIKATGSFSMIAQRQWDPSRTYHADALTTTGLIVSEFLLKEIDVYFNINPANSRTIGTMSTLLIGPLQTLSIVFQDSFGSKSTQNWSNITLYQADFSTEMQATTLKIKGTLLPGKFYIQYYGIDGTPLSSSSSQPITNAVTSTLAITNSTSTSVLTTTRSASSARFILSSITIFVFGLKRNL